MSDTPTCSPPAGGSGAHFLLRLVADSPLIQAAPSLRGLLFRLGVSVTSGRCSRLRRSGPASAFLPIARAGDAHRADRHDSPVLGLGPRPLAVTEILLGLTSYGSRPKLGTTSSRRPRCAPTELFRRRDATCEDATSYGTPLLRLSAMNDTLDKAAVLGHLQDACRRGDGPAARARPRRGRARSTRRRAAGMRRCAARRSTRPCSTRC